MRTNKSNRSSQEDEKRRVGYFNIIAKITGLTEEEIEALK